MYDDVVTIENNELLRSPVHIPGFFEGSVDHAGEMDGAYRPLFLSALTFIGPIGAFHPAWLKFVSLLLHALNAFLLFLLGTRVFRLSPKAAFIAGALFLVHPIQITDLALVWKQSDLWVMAITLLSLIVYEKSSLAAAGLFLLGLGFKESALVLPTTLVKHRTPLQTKR